MISNIKSKYVLLHIYKFIKDEHFALKLFFHSKYFQNKLDINYSYCYEKYLDELNFDLNVFLFKDENEYKKDILRRTIKIEILILEKFLEMLYICNNTYFDFIFEIILFLSIINFSAFCSK